MAPLNRRQLVQGSAAAAAAAGLTSAAPVIRSRPFGRSDEIRVAVVGVRGRGNNHIDGMQHQAGVDVAALVDVDAQVLAGRREELLKKKVERGDAWKGGPVDTYADMRAVLDRSDIDAISIATPNHLHALQTIWSCQAGKDVYVEKPVCHNIFEGGVMVRAARSSGRIVQTGTQSRSSQGMAQAIAWAQAGNLGKPLIARGTCFKPRQSIGKVDGPQKVGEHVNWDLYCGPAPLEPLERRQLHYDWHWQFATGNGDLGNQGIHQVDMCRWAIGAQELAPAVGAIGGRFGYDDDGDTPNSIAILLAYEPVPILFEVRGLPRDKATQAAGWNGGGMDRFRGSAIGATLECEGGWLHLPNYSSAIAYDLEGKEIRQWSGATDHFENFIEAVRARDVEHLHADIREGHLSSSLCHMGNISYLRGKTMDKAQVAAQVGEHAQGKLAFTRLAEHLERNEVDLGKHKLTLGPWLEFDPKAERFTTDDEANALLTRDYRAPFTVSEEV